MAKPKYTDGQRVKLPASVIRTDMGTQSRDKTNPKTIEEYAALMRDGVEFDPVTVFYTPDGEHILSRGFHRLPAAIDAGRGDIDAIIRLGTLADAKWDSAGSNKHGLRCTPADYEKAVALALSVKPKASDREIAQHLGISGPTVAKYRPAPTANAFAVQTRVGKDGKERKLPERKPKADKPPIEKPPEKQKAPAQKVDRRDGQDEYREEGEDREVETVETVETGAETVDRIAGDFASPAAKSEAAHDKPAPEGPQWTIEESDAADALIEKARTIFGEYLKKHPALVERLGQFLMGQVSIVNAQIKARRQS